MDILPRFIRHRDAPGYLGVDRNKFDAEIRPHLTAIPLGTRSLAFDRHELDAWADEYKQLHGRPGRKLAETLTRVEMASVGEKIQRPPQGKPARQGAKAVVPAPANKRSAGVSGKKKETNLEKARRAIEETRKTLLK